METKSKGKGQKMLILLLMIISMCTIYVLPYLRYQFFTPLQEAMGLAGETQKYGNLVTVYGVMNILMYLPGGIIADRFNPKKLMVFSMISSGVLGLWMATWPGYEMLLLIHILWGFTTVLTFWSTSVKVINMLASSDEQGTMFGMLESGRGILNMLLNFAWVGVFAMFANRGKLGMTVVVAAVSILMIISGVLLGFLLPPMDVDQTSNTSVKDSLKSLLGAFKLPITYILAAMIFVPSAISATGSYYAPYLETAAGLTYRIVLNFFGYPQYGDSGDCRADMYGNRQKARTLQPPFVLGMCSARRISGRAAACSRNSAVLMAVNDIDVPDLILLQLLPCGQLGVDR